MKKLLLATAIISILFSCSKPENNPEPVQQTVIITTTPTDTIVEYPVYKLISKLNWNGLTNFGDTTLVTISFIPDNQAIEYNITDGDTLLISQGNAYIETIQIAGDTLVTTQILADDNILVGKNYILFRNETILQLETITYNVFENAEIFQISYSHIYGDFNEYNYGWTMTYSKIY